jgi:Tfp pilus assembly protein PilF
MKGFNYQRQHDCFPCMKSTSKASVRNQDDWRMCTSPSKVETVDRNIAACTRIIDNPKTSRDDLIIAYHARCVEYNTKKEFHLALLNCNASLSGTPDTAVTLNSRGVAYEGLGKIDQAIADYRRAASLGSEDARRNLVNLGAK